MELVSNASPKLKKGITLQEAKVREKIIQG